MSESAARGHHPQPDQDIESDEDLIRTIQSNRRSGSTATTQPLSVGRKLRYCLRCARNNEPWWEWSWGRWKWSAGAIFGLGLCLVIRHDEINVMLGPFAVGGFRG
jgi:hypothetical protein